MFLDTLAICHPQPLPRTLEHKNDGGYDSNCDNKVEEENKEEQIYEESEIAEVLDLETQSHSDRLEAVRLDKSNNKSSQMLEKQVEKPEAAKTSQSERKVTPSRSDVKDDEIKLTIVVNAVTPEQRAAMENGQGPDDSEVRIWWPTRDGRNNLTSSPSKALAGKTEKPVVLEMRCSRDMPISWVLSELLRHLDEAKQFFKGDLKNSVLEVIGLRRKVDRWQVYFTYLLQ